MYYKSRTDLEIVQIPSSVPPMGPAGDIVMDPDFDNLIIRMTDENSMTIPAGSQCYAGIGGSADVNVWNTDSTLIYLQDQGGGGGIFGFNPRTLSCARLFPGWRVPGALLFSKLDPNIAFNFYGRQFLRYDLSDRTLNTPPAPEVVCDFTSQLPGGKATWQTVGGVEGADTIFTCAFSTTGSQGTGVYACCYTIGKGYQTYNTSTGVISGDFGTGTITIPDRYTIHNVKCSKDGNTLVIGLTTALAGECIGPMFWTLGTTNVQPMVRVARGGHWTAGYGDF